MQNRSDAPARGAEKFRCEERRGSEHMRTCYEQCVHARRRLRGLEHLVDVLLGQRGLASALPLGVLLLPPLEVLGKVGKQRKAGKKREKDGGAECMIRRSDGDRRGKIFGRRKETRRLCRGMVGGGGRIERGVLRADRDGVICGGLTVGKSVRCRVSGEPKSLVNLEGWSRE